MFRAVRTVAACRRVIGGDLDTGGQVDVQVREVVRRAERGAPLHAKRQLVVAWRSCCPRVDNLPNDSDGRAVVVVVQR